MDGLTPINIKVAYTGIGELFKNKRKGGKVGKYRDEMEDLGEKYR